jgi:NTP pyrophosphatase (non-canonical NTP hydrolase)
MKSLNRQIKEFIKERDWEQYHSPKNLSMALSAEASEIVEIFQWLTEEQSFKLNEKKAQHLKEEIGDVLIYLLELASKFDIDPLEAAKSKIKLNAKKYPADKVKGKMKKYNEYD